MSAYYRFKNKDTKTRVQKIKEALDTHQEQTGNPDNPDNQKTSKDKFKLPSDPGKDPSSPLRQLGVTDTFAGVRASNNFMKKKIIGEGMSIQIPIKSIILESEFLRNRPMLSAGMAAGIGGLATYDYMKTKPSSFGNYVDTKVNQIKNIELPKISMPQTHQQTLGEKVGEGLDKFKHILPRPANSGLSNSLLNQ